MKAKRQKPKFEHDLLLKLADHLESGKLGHPTFDFTTFNSTLRYDMSPRKPVVPGCGTNGCAIGELPVLFPKLWKFNRLNGWPVRRTRRTECDPFSIVQAEMLFQVDNDPLVHAAMFFRINALEVHYLFTDTSGYSKSVAPWNKEHSTTISTADQVAKSIRRFVKWKNLNTDFNYVDYRAAI